MSYGTRTAAIANAKLEANKAQAKYEAAIASGNRDEAYIAAMREAEASWGSYCELLYDTQ